MVVTVGIGPSAVASISNDWLLPEMLFSFFLSTATSWSVYAFLKSYANDMKCSPLPVNAFSAVYVTRKSVLSYTCMSEPLLASVSLFTTAPLLTLFTMGTTTTVALHVLLFLSATSNVILSLRRTGVTLNLKPATSMSGIVL